MNVCRGAVLVKFYLFFYVYNIISWAWNLIHTFSLSLSLYMFLSFDLVSLTHTLSCSTLVDDTQSNLLLSPPKFHYFNVQRMGWKNGWWKWRRLKKRNGKKMLKGNWNVLSSFRLEVQDFSTTLLYPRNKKTIYAFNFKDQIKRLI